MLRVPNAAAKHVLWVLLVIWPALLQAQQTYDLAVDYYVGRAVKEAGILRDEATVDFASLRAVSFFFRVQGNQDGVVSVTDTLDITRSFAARRNHSGPRDFARYDLNQDGIATQSELEISLAQKTWVSSSVVFPQTRSRFAVEERFRELIAERTTILRDRVGAAPDVDIEALGDSYRPLEDLQQLLNETSVWGPPFFSLFDTNSNLQVDFEEFTTPIFAALLAADTDSDGVFSADERNRIAEAHDTAEAALERSDGGFSFPDPR